VIDPAARPSIVEFDAALEREFRRKPDLAPSTATAIVLDRLDDRARVRLGFDLAYQRAVERKAARANLEGDR
jgi:hypothetical protein